MPITLETVLGSTNIVDEDRLLYVHIDKLNGNGPAITSNFARSVNSGYVVVEVPEEIEQFLLNTFTKDEQDLVSVYVLEEKELVEEHNRKERQKIENWKNREKQKIDDWESIEKQKAEEYELETAIIEEETQQEKAQLEQASKSPYLIFDALESRGHNVGTYRSQYEQRGHLTPVRSKMIVTQLNQEGINDEYLLEDVIALVENRGLLDEDRTWLLLEEQLGIIIPTVASPQILEYPTLPTPEPRPKTEPRPEIIIKEVTPLLEELENVVLGAYRGLSLKDLNLTPHAWKDVGIIPEEIYAKVRKDFKILNDQYMLVKVVGNGNGDTGSLTLAELDINQKKGLNQRITKSLRRYFHKPADLVEDTYILFIALYGVTRDFLSDDEEAVKILKSEKRSYLQKAIYEKLFGGVNSIMNNLFPEQYGANNNEQDARKYKEIAERVDSALKDGLMGGENSVSYVVADMGAPVTDLVDTITQLTELIPEEIFKLRYFSDQVRRTRKQLNEMLKNQDNGNRLTSSGMGWRDHLQSKHDYALEERDRLIPQFDSLVEGSAKWGTRLNPKETIKSINSYGLGKGSNYTVAAK